VLREEDAAQLFVFFVILLLHFLSLIVSLFPLFAVSPRFLVLLFKLLVSLMGALDFSSDCSLLTVSLCHYPVSLDELFFGWIIFNFLFHLFHLLLHDLGPPCVPFVIAIVPSINSNQLVKNLVVVDHPIRNELILLLHILHPLVILLGDKIKLNALLNNDLRVDSGQLSLVKLEFA